MIALYVHWSALGYATIGFALAALIAAVLLAILDVRDDRFNIPERPVPPPPPEGFYVTTSTHYIPTTDYPTGDPAHPLIVDRPFDQEND